MKRYYKMKKEKSLLILPAALLIPVAAYSDVKIGIFDLQRALFETEAWEMVQSEIEAEIDSDRTTSEILLEELQGLQSQLERDAATLSTNEVQKIHEEGRVKQLRLQQISTRILDIVQTRQQSFLERYRQSLSEAIDEVYTEGEYDIILNSDSVVMFGFSFDITGSVTAKLNESIL